MLSPMVGYAATALGYIALSKGGPVQVREVASAVGVPAPYLSKIVHRLSKRGLLATRRGIGGGVQLAFDPGTFSLHDLCEALDDPILRAHCLLGLGTCDDDVACPAHEFSRRIRAKQLEFLKRTTVLDVGRFDVERQRRGAPRRAARGGGDASSARAKAREPGSKRGGRG